MKKDFIPGRDGDLDTWEENFLAEVDAVAATLHIDPTEVTNTKTSVSGHRSKFTDMNTAKNAAASAVSSNKTAKQTSVTGVRALANRIKSASGYTEDMGRTLGIIGAESTFDPDTAKPVVTIEMAGGFPKINFNHPAEVDGVYIYSKRGTEAAFTFIATDTQTPYIDTRENLAPGVAENRKYYAFFFIDDSVIGLQSDEVNISITR